MIRKKNTYVCSGDLISNLYFLKPITHALDNIELSNSNKRAKTYDSNESYLWYLRLSHIGQERIKRLVRDDLLTDLKDVHFSQCESCLEGKLTKRSFGVKGNKAKELLELVHTDICGLMNIKIRGGYEYYVTFIDEYSRFEYDYLMQQKSETFQKFKEYHAEVERQLG